MAHRIRPAGAVLVRSRDAGPRWKSAAPGDPLAVATGDGPRHRLGCHNRDQPPYLPDTVPGLTGPGTRVRASPSTRRAAGLRQRSEGLPCSGMSTDPGEPLLAAGLPCPGGGDGPGLRRRRLLGTWPPATRTARSTSGTSRSSRPPSQCQRAARRRDVRRGGRRWKRCGSTRPGTLPEREPAAFRPDARPGLGRRPRPLARRRHDQARLSWLDGWHRGGRHRGRQASRDRAAFQLRAAALSPGGGYGRDGRQCSAGACTWPISTAQPMTKAIPLHPRVLDGAELSITGVAFTGLR